ncbi:MULTISPECIES: hypothetical protein [Hyphomonas]|uniref:hypothetical protein n=1 Tax=Hyphomonas TaxID=85 RepID=UPI0005524978|nr:MULTISPECIES: hypothetical protein [Hyphomonas]
MSGLRVFALSALLSAAPVLPSLSEAPRPEAVAGAGDVETLFAQALARPAARGGAQSFDPAQLQALFGDAAALTFTGNGIDRASGAQRLDGVTLTLPGAQGGPLLIADEALIWNLDTAALSARLRGERLGDTVRIFDRIELKGVSLDLTDYAGAVNDAVNTALDDPQAAMTETSAMEVGTLVLGGLTLHPWTHEAVEGEDDGVAALRLVSTFARSVSLDTAFFQDVVNTQTVSDTAVSGSAVSKYPRQLVYGYDRGKIGGAIQTGVTFEGIFEPGISETGEVIPEGLAMSGSSGFGSWTGADFSKLLEWGERGEMPPFSERDLWNLGSYTLEDTSISLSGKPVMEIGRMAFTATKFSWFLPEEIQVSHEDVSMDMGAFLEFAIAIDPEAAQKSSEGPSLVEIAAMLDKVGLNKLSGDGAFTFRWNPETGAAQLENTGTADGLFAGSTKVDATLPSYAALAPMFGEDGQSFDAKDIDDLLEDHLVLKNAATRLTDMGGLNTLAALTIEIAKSGAIDDPMAANFANATPETVRMFASGLVMMGSASMTEDFPQATAWAGKLSQFLTGGGTLEVSAAPEPGLFKDTGLDSGGMSAQTPGALAELLGIAVTHTPAPAKTDGR